MLHSLCFASLLQTHSLHLVLYLLATSFSRNQFTPLIPSITFPGHLYPYLHFPIYCNTTSYFYIISGGVLSTNIFSVSPIVTEYVRYLVLCLYDNAYRSSNNNLVSLCKSTQENTRWANSPPEGLPWNPETLGGSVACSIFLPLGGGGLTWLKHVGMSKTNQYSEHISTDEQHMHKINKQKVKWQLFLNKCQS